MYFMRKFFVMSLILFCGLTILPLCLVQATDFNDDLNVKGTITSGGKITGIGMVPPGGIIMFSGDISKAYDANGAGLKGTPYEGWQICNGNNGAPDLRDRFISAAGRNYKVGDQGGADAVALAPDHLPPHNHTASISVSGAHQHWIEGTDADGLAWRQRRIPGETTADMGYGGGRNADPNQMHWRGSVNTDTTGDHAHALAINNTGAGRPHENRPLFYALAFIMRLP